MSDSACPHIHYRIGGGDRVQYGLCFDCKEEVPAPALLANHLHRIEVKIDMMIPRVMSVLNGNST